MDMKNNASPSKEQLIKHLEIQIQKLRAELAKITSKQTTKDPLKITLTKSQKRYTKIENPHGADMAIGEFFLTIDITAVTETIYIPLSIASGKKPAGFVYQIEGTKKGSISKTDISVNGDTVTQITLGTILYAKIPVGKKASFRILIEIRGQMQNSYQITIATLNYKKDPKDARYQKLDTEISSETLKFG